MSRYADSAEWADVVPIPQNDSGPDTLAAIAYEEEYSEAMSYFRAITAKDEKSERALDLTEEIISMNPAHYTVWYNPLMFFSDLSLPFSDKMGSQAIPSKHPVRAAKEEQDKSTGGSARRTAVAGYGFSKTPQELPDLVLFSRPPPPKLLFGGAGLHLN